ncbi:MAG: phosphoribosyltransferase family protein, partial [Candidatus Puniceispirillaceae bacterium]
SLKRGTIMVRKAGKLPGKVLEEAYALEYGTARLSMHASRAVKGKRVVLCDDLLATGGTLAAAEKLVERAGGQVAGAICVIELTGLKGREKLGCDVAALQRYAF